MPTRSKCARTVTDMPFRPPTASPDIDFSMPASSLSPPPSADSFVPASSPSTLPPSSDFSIDDDTESDFKEENEVIDISDDEECHPNKNHEVIIISSDDETIEDYKMMSSDADDTDNDEEQESEVARLLGLSSIYPFVNRNLMPKWVNCICRLPAKVLCRDRFQARVLAADYEEVRVILSADQTGDGYPFDTVNRGDFFIFCGKVTEGGTALEMRSLQEIEGLNMVIMNTIIEFSHRREWVEAALARLIKQEEE